MLWVRLASSVTAALLLSSCATIRHTFTCPAQGGAEWRELRSEHVLLQTDLSQSRAEELLRDAEQMRALVLAALFKQPPQLPDRIHLVAFRTDRELWEFTDEGGYGSTFATFALRVEPASADPLLAVAPDWGKYRSSYLAGLTAVVTWQLSSHLFPGQPDWLRIGLATSMEPLAIDRDGGRRYVGGLPDDIVGPPWEVPDTLAITLRGESPGFGQWGLRSPGWMLVRWLAEVHAADYMAFLKQLAAGADGKAAWLAAFPQWDPDRPEQMAALEAELKAFFTNGKLRYREVTASVAPTWTTISLATPEVHALRIRLRRGTWGDQATKERDIQRMKPEIRERVAARKARLEAETVAELAEALREAPLHPAVLRIAAGDQPLDPAQARAALERYPQDWRAWLLLGEALQGNDAGAAASAFRKVGELAPSEPAALLGVARGLLAVDDTPAALPRAREAMRLAPYSDEALTAQAAALARTGACPEALAAAKRLRARLEAGEDPRADQQLEQVASRCPAGEPTIKR